MSSLHEDKRIELLNKSKRSVKGKQRFDRRNKSRVANTVKAFNSIDMNKLFKDDILTVNIPIQGETDDYVVRITFGGFLEILRDQVSPGEDVNFRHISRVCIIGFNRDDVFINCSCPDFHYRFGYYATKNNINSGAPETRPSNITNPDDNLGSACKHVLLVLNNTSWILRVSRVISNYIQYMKKHYDRLYADVIYPAIYGAAYEDPIQLTIDDNGSDELQTDTTTIDDANIERQKETRFQKGNTRGARFARSDQENLDDQVTFEEPLDSENPDDTL